MEAELDYDLEAVSDFNSDIMNQSGLTAKDLDFLGVLQRHIPRKKWQDIVSAWAYVNYKPGNAGSQIEDGDALADSEILLDYCKELKSRKEIYSIKNYKEVRSTVLREAIFLVHKASNAISSAEQSVQTGYKTWSITGAYHGAYLAAKSIIYLHGIAIPSFKKFNNETLLIDCIPGWGSNNPQFKKSGIVVRGEEVVITKPTSGNFDQRHIWLTLRFLFDSTTYYPFEEVYRKLINNIENASFAKQRNNLMYGSASWMFDDLHDRLIDHQFGIVDSDFLKSYRLSEEDGKSSFTLNVAMILMNISLSLLSSIASTVKTVKPEVDIFERKLNESASHPIYTCCTF